MDRFCSRAVLTTVMLALLCSPASAATIQLMGVNRQTGQLFDIDKFTGQTSNPRPLGFTPIGITAGPDGKLYSVSPGQAPFSVAYKVDPLTGTSTSIGQTNLFFVAEGDVAFSPSGTLYGIGETNINNGNITLFTVNTSTGAGTIVGSLPASADDTSGLAFAPNGTLYALDTRGNVGGPALLYTLDPATAAITHTTALSITFPQFTAVAGLTFDPTTGIMYAATNTAILYTVDPITGLAVPLGSMGSLGNFTSGLAFATVPEPGMSTVLMGSCIALIIRSRRVKT